MSARFFLVISPTKYGRLGLLYFWEVGLWLLKVCFCALSITFGTLKVIETFPDVARSGRAEEESKNWVFIFICKQLYVQLLEVIKT